MSSVSSRPRQDVLEAKCEPVGDAPPQGELGVLSVSSLRRSVSQLMEVKMGGDEDVWDPNTSGQDSGMVREPKNVSLSPLSDPPPPRVRRGSDLTPQVCSSCSSWTTKNSWTPSKASARWGRSTPCSPTPTFDTSVTFEPGPCNLWSDQRSIWSSCRGVGGGVNFFVYLCSPGSIRADERRLLALPRRTDTTSHQKFNLKKIKKASGSGFCYWFKYPRSMWLYFWIYSATPWTHSSSA